MKLLKLLLILLIALVLVGYLLPTKYDISQDIVINAPPEAIHAYVGELKVWPQWTPWAEMDPGLTVNLGLVTTGVGASQSWTGDSSNGELTFTTCSVEQGIAYDMAFLMDGERVPAQGAIRYAPVEGGTQVTWSIQGDAAESTPPIVAGYMTLAMPMMMRGMFEDGLGKLKQVVEQPGG